MKLYHLMCSNEAGDFVFADNEKEAKKLLKQYYKETDDELLEEEEIKVIEVIEVKKGVCGGINWTEPEPPLFEA